jgi:formiminotetrahydrofolate cyclodeaminase
VQEALLDLELRDFLARIGAPEQGPGGGTAAALTVAVAAGLVVMVARRSRDSWAEAAGVSAQALAVQERVAPLAEADADAWAAALQALDASRGDDELERMLAEAVEIPLRIGEAAADVAAMAALAAELGEGTFRGDAAAAALLAEAAARAAGRLVSVNLTVTEKDERLLRARRSEQLAAEAVARALDAGP